MNTEDFPDRPPRAGSTTPPATIDNVSWLLKQSGIQCRYNTVKKKVEIDIPDYQGTLDNQDNVTMTHVVNLAKRVGMPHELVGEFTNAIADRNAYNPAADWITSKGWDGLDRLRTFQATVTTQADYPIELKDMLLTKWLRSAAAAALRPRFRSRGVLTLQGGQGIGKTRWTAALVSDPNLRESVVRLDHLLDPSSKDSITGAITNWIVEIGELDSSFKRDVGRMKGFLTRDADPVRRPYDRRESEYRRSTVFIATVNEANFLVDPTGNSRFWTIACDRLDYQHKIDMQQVFAQVAADVDAGAEWWLDATEEAMLAAWNDRHKAVSVIAEQLDQWIDHDEIGHAGLPSMTPTEVLSLIGYERPTNAQARECGAVLRDLLGEPRRINGRDRWRVPLRVGTAADLQPPGKRPTPPSKPVIGVDENEIF